MPRVVKHLRPVSVAAGWRVLQTFCLYLGGLLAHRPECSLCFYHIRRSCRFKATAWLNEQDNWPRRGRMRSVVILLFTIWKREAISIPLSSHPGVPECIWYNIKCIPNALRMTLVNNQNQTCK